MVQTFFFSSEGRDLQCIPMIGGSYLTQRPKWSIKYPNRLFLLLSSVKFKSNQFYNMNNSESQQDPAPGQARSNNPSSSEEMGMGFARFNPLLPRIYADDQDKKTLCIFWVVLFFILFLILILSHFAVPTLLQKNDRNLYKTTPTYCTFPQTPVIQGDKLLCGNYYSSSSIAEMVFDWGPMNQFAKVYLQIVPQNLNTPLNFNLTMNISLYTITSKFNQQLQQAQFMVDQLVDSVNQTIQFSSSKAQDLYASDDTTKLGYTVLVAILTRLEQDRFFINIEFDRTLSSSDVKSLYSQSYAVSSAFTAYTFILRYFFFATSIIALILFFIRFQKIPKEKRILEQYFTAAITIFLVMFNDPFYPITILKPNGGSAFFSIVFVVNLIVCLFLFWISTADRIKFEDGQLKSQEPDKKKIVFIIILWLQLVICTMIYSIHQITVSPIVTSQFADSFLPARIIIIITLVLYILYIAFRYAQICAAAQTKLWRSYIFIVFSSIFIIIIFIIAVSNTFIPYNYEGSAIFFAYSFVNIYVYYIQYMFTITSEETQKMQAIQENGGIEGDHDVLTIGSIDIVDVDIGQKQNRKRAELGQEEISEDNEYKVKYDVVEREEDSEMPVATAPKNKSQFQSFDFQ